MEALQCPIDAEFVFQVLMVDFSERDDAVLVGDLEVLQIGRQVPEIEDPIAMCKLAGRRLDEQIRAIARRLHFHQVRDIAPAWGGPVHHLG